MFRLHHLLLLVFVTFAGLAFNSYSGDTTSEITETMDLASIGMDSKHTKRPILLLMSQEDCAFCRLVKREILNPMVLSGNYEKQIIIREFMIDAFDEPRDFDGTNRDAELIAKGYKIKVTPTLLFLGPDGEELTERIVGINTVELFSYYVDEAIKNAVISLNK